MVEVTSRGKLAVGAAAALASLAFAGLANA